MSTFSWFSSFLGGHPQNKHKRGGCRKKREKKSERETKKLMMR
jgi:hypothetical protein